MQKIALRGKEIYADYAQRFDDETIQAPPYRYRVVSVDDDVPTNELVASDFKQTKDGWQFDRAAYETRTRQVCAERARAQYVRDVQLRIRAAYSLEEELSVLRRRDSDPERFCAYNAYCEECKRAAKARLAESAPADGA